MVMIIIIIIIISYFLRFSYDSLRFLNSMTNEFISNEEKVKLILSIHSVLYSSHYNFC